MNVKTRSMSKKQEMTASSDSKKLDDLLTKMDALLEAKNDMLTKLNKKFIMELLKMSTS